MSEPHREKTAESVIAGEGTLTVVRRDGAGAGLYLAIHADGRVTGFSGHVDLGTGIRTALAQIVAEELDVPFARVAMVLGSTATVPNQGPTIASETIQVAAIPLRAAAATARAHLLARAAERLGAEAAGLVVEDGVVRAGAPDNRFVSYGDLVAGAPVSIEIDDAAPLKPVAQYRIVGWPVPRTDIPAKATGSFVYVHDVRVPGMLHGRVVRPPYAGFDSGPHVGASLVAIDEASVAGVPGLVAVVREGDFVGVVAEREEQAILAMQRLAVTWREPPQIPDLNRPEEPLRANTATPRTLADRGDIAAALEGSPLPMDRTYVWPYHMHGSIGPSCAVAHATPEALVTWSGTQNPHMLRAELARLMDLDESAIIIERHEAAGCYGRNGADDVTCDAAVLSRAVGRPVRVQLTREQEHAWEPKGAAQVMDVRGGLDAAGDPAAYDFETRYPSNVCPSLALLLTGKVPPVPVVAQMGDRTAIPPYAVGNLRVVVHDMPPIARASWLRGVSAMPNSFAHESYFDELAAAAKVDPIEYRLRYLDDTRAADLVRAVAERAGWEKHTTHGTRGGEGDILYGRGFAYARYIHGTFPGVAAAWAAWVVDVAVDKTSGDMKVTRIVCGQDTGQMVNPDGVRHQIHGNVIQSTSRVIKEAVGFNSTAVASREWGAYPILTFPELPEIETLLMERQEEPPLGAGESASVPAGAAIANALYDATGIRFRELPLTPEKIRAALNPLPPAEAVVAPARRRRRWAWPFAGAFAGALAAGAAIAPLPKAIAPIARPAADVFSPATIESGRLVAAAGMCNVCHVGGDGTAFAGGRALETPFGTVYATNITPDPTAGIGAWSYPAFARAMREGVSRDGHHLYPAHPYTAFAKASEADLQSLYAYLMTQPAAAAKAPETRLGGVVGIRPLMAAWNTLFLSASPAPADPARPLWSRGAELVEGLGHCSACHSPRNPLGAEIGGERHLSGGVADGWIAPSLKGDGPVPWTEAALYDYLRTGHAADHGGAHGPMAAVVASLAPLPDTDIRAMATYLASLAPAVPAAEVEAVASLALATSEAATAAAAVAEPVGARIFAGACASCHEGVDGGAPLALNAGVHAAEPLNVLNAIREGAKAPPGHLSDMPAFADSLDEAAIAALARYVRARYAPEAAPWAGLGGG